MAASAGARRCSPLACNLAGATLGLLERGLRRPRDAIAQLETTGRIVSDAGLREPAGRDAGSRPRRRPRTRG